MSDDFRAICHRSFSPVVRRHPHTYHQMVRFECKRLVRAYKMNVRFRTAHAKLSISNVNNYGQWTPTGIVRASLTVGVLEISGGQMISPRGGKWFVCGSRIFVNTLQYCSNIKYWKEVLVHHLTPPAHPRRSTDTAHNWSTVFDRDRGQMFNCDRG